MKRFLLFFLAILMLALTSCANDMPLPDEDNPNHEDGKIDIPSLDSSLYQYSTLYQHLHNFQNIPGALLVHVSENGSSLYCLDKSAGELRMFCFDPLCNHSQCVSRLLPLTKMLVYQPYDGNIYGVPFEYGKKGGSRLYCVDGNTQDIRCVWEGNGNVIDSDFLYVYEQYLYFPVKRIDVGYDLFRYDVEQEEIEKMEPPSGKTFRYVFYISGDTFVATFTDDDAYYLTDMNFQRFKKTSCPRIYYMNGEHTIHILHGKRNQQSVSVGFGYHNLTSGQSYTILEQETPIYPAGFDGSYLYFIEYEWDGTAYMLGDILYRISVDGGAAEFVYDFDGTLREVVSFEDTLYYYRKEYQDGKAVHIYGRLTQNDDGFSAEDFPIAQS